MIRKNPLRQEDGDENELFGFVMETAKRSARSLGMDEDEIEQIVSNVAFKLYTSPAFREVATGDRGSSRPRLNGYVRTTARRERAGVIEEKQRQRQTQLPLNAVEDFHAETSDLCARIANAITLERAMEKLDPKLGRIVRMHIYDDMSMSEIAAKLDLPKATVKSRYRSARGQLRVLLGDQGDAEVN